VSVVLLVRHGQASWGAADYDVLSPLGAEQARLLGRELAARGLSPDVVAHGSLQRQQETARLLVEAATWDRVPTVDAGWDEMDHLQVLARSPRPQAADRQTRSEFQAWFEAATDRWTGGDFDSEYDEAFPSFGERVAAALGALTAGLGPDGVAVVVTSGGPIARVAAELLAPAAVTAVYRRLAPVLVNSSVSKLVVGRRGTTLVSFNEHAHLERTGARLLTYR
jgi:broad specificity phosphatase PhoE